MSKAKGRKVRASEAERLLEEWEASGERMSAWCRARGLNWYSLSAFKGWLATRGQGVELAEVVLAEPGPAVGRYRLELRGVVVEVDDHFRDDTLRRLLRTVAAC